MAKSINITLGADPEFELIIAERAESAASILGDAIHLPWGSIGVDGAGYPLELRPNPSETARGLIQNVARLLVGVPRMLGGLPSTVGEAYAIGGHIHVGIGNAPVDERALVRGLDEAIGDILYSLSPESRIKAGYGRRRDWRIQPWGIEYRTPPAAIWAHPQVALVFVGATKWVVREFLGGRDPLKSPALPKIRGAAKSAAAFVRQHGSRLHWGAWEALAGEVEIPQEGPVIVIDHGADRDHLFVGDLKGLLLRLGLRWLRVTSLRRSRGDYVSNLPGYGELVEGFSVFAPRGTLCLSWRFRNDAEFRRAEMPKLEAALAAALRAQAAAAEVDDGGGRIIKEAVPFKVSGSASAEPETTPVEAEAPLDEGHVRCAGCDELVHESVACQSDAGDWYCEECYHDIYTMCARCDAELRNDAAYFTDGGDGPYCEDCYYELYGRCANCDREVLLDDACRNSDGEVYCERCYHRLFTECSHCRTEVPMEGSHWINDGVYCQDCFEELFTLCERCGNYYPNEDIAEVDGGALCWHCRYEQRRNSEEESVVEA